MEREWKWKKFLWKYTLEYDGTVYSIINRRRIFTGGYWDIFIPFIGMYDHPEILMIGLGGGTVPFQARALFKDNFTMDIVEISNESIEKASEVVNLGREHIIKGDGFDYLMKNDKKYDIIILDAYQDRKIPEKFYTPDFFLSSFVSLKDDGILLINYALNIYGTSRLKNFRDAANQYFTTFRIGPTIIEENIIIVCLKNLNPDEIKMRIKRLNGIPGRLRKRVMKMRRL